jgi:hypothetical protein
MLSISKKGDEAMPFGVARKVICISARIEGTNEEIGKARIFLDELIDAELNDLAKEHCLVLSRAELIDAKVKAAVREGKTQEQAKKPFEKHSEYSGILRVQTLFLPTKDTALRFEKTQNTASMMAEKMRKPLQLLHYELLVEKSDFDAQNHKIPCPAYNPNDRLFGVKEVNIDRLLEQAAGNQKVVGVL